MSAITELAGRLGKAIADSPQAAALRAAREGLDSQPEVKQLLTDFTAQSRKIAQLEAEQKAIEVSDKHKLQELQDKLIAQEVFKQYTAAQVDYVDLMRQVNESLQQKLAATEGETAS